MLMRLSLLILVLVMCNTLLRSQDRLTEHIGGGTTLGSYIRTVDGNTYILQVDNCDSLTTYLVHDIDDFELLHSELIPGLYYEIFIDFNGSRICYGIEDTFFIYDYVKDEHIAIAVPDGFKYHNQLRVDHEHFLLELEDSDHEIYFFVYTSDGQWYQLNDNYFYQLEGNLLVEQLREESGNYSYVLWDFINNTQDTIIKQALTHLRPIQHGEYIYYLNESGKIESFNVETKDVQVISEKIVEYENVSIYRIEVYEDKLVLAYSLTYNSNSSVVIYELSSNQVLSEVGFSQEYDISSLVVSEGVVYTRSVWGDSFIMNIENGNYLQTQSSGIVYDVILNGKEIIYWKIIGPGFDCSLNMLDVETMTEYELGYFTNLWNYSHLGLAQFDDYALFAYKDFYVDNTNVFNVDLDSRTIEKNSIIDKTDQGFSRLAEIVTIESGILILDDGVYHYGANGLMELQGKDGYYNLRYAHNSSHFYFQYNGITYSFDGYELEKLTEENISDFVVTEDQLFYISYFEGLCSIDLNNGLKSVVVQNDFIYDFKIIEDRLFYYDHDSLYLYESNLSIAITDILFIDDFPVAGVGDEILILTKEGLFSIDENQQLNPIMIGDMFASSNSYASVINRSGNDLLFGISDSTFHYDGNTVQKLKTEDDSYYSFRELGSDYFFSWKSISNVETGHLYDPNSHTLSEIPFDHGLIQNIFEHNGKEYALVPMKRFEAIQCYAIYEYNDGFQVDEPIVMFDNINGGSDGNVAFVGDNGLLMVGSRLVHINSNSEFELLDNKIFIDSSNDQFIVKDDLIYFIGKDKFHGRQLYSYDPISTRLDQILAKNESFFIYPNPTSGLIAIDSQIKFDKVTVYDLSGNLMMSETSEEEIDISQYQSGVYFLTLETKEGIYSQRVVKL